jgi:hypothetical protein
MAREGNDGVGFCLRDVESGVGRNSDIFEHYVSTIRHCRGDIGKGRHCAHRACWSATPPETPLNTEGKVIYMKFYVRGSDLRPEIGDAQAKSVFYSVKPCGGPVGLAPERLDATHDICEVLRGHGVASERDREHSYGGDEESRCREHRVSLRHSQRLLI